MTKVRLPRIRELVAHRSYVLIYEVVTDQIQVLRVLHYGHDLTGPSKTFCRVHVKLQLLAADGGKLNAPD